MRKLRAEGLDIYLIINGNNPEEIDLGAYPWVRLYERQPLQCFSELLGSIDVGVIPYVDQEYLGTHVDNKDGDVYGGWVANLIASFGRDGKYTC